jgi:quinol monooxygenase YgiN
MIYVATYIDVQPSFANDAIGMLQRYGDASRREKGSAEVLVLQETSRGNRFVVIEAWDDESSFETHEAAEHTAQVRSKLKGIQNSPNDQRVHQEFSSATPHAEAPPGVFNVVTHVDVPPPRREETEALLKTLAEAARSDEGNARYDIFQQKAPRTNHFTVLAVWQNDSAFASHQLKPHTRAFRELLGPMLGAPYDERFYARLKN